MKKIPSPGSDDAIKAGCLCPSMDNSHGLGYMGQKDVFCVTANCPLHGTEARSNREKDNDK